MTSTKLYSPSNLDPAAIVYDIDMSPRLDQPSAVLVLGHSEEAASAVVDAIVSAHLEVSAHLKADLHRRLESAVADAETMGTLLQSIRRDRKDMVTRIVSLISPLDDQEMLTSLFPFARVVVDTRLPAWMPVIEL